MKEDNKTNNTEAVNPTAFIPTISTDNTRRGRRAGMPPPEEKKDD